MAVKNLLVRGGADFSGMQREMAKAQKSLSNFQNNVGGIMKKIGGFLGGLAVGKLIMDSTQMAMGVESAIDNINRNMGTSAKAFQSWTNTQAQSLGIAKADAYKYGSTFSNLLSSFTKGTKETASETTELMKAAAIIASKTGRSYKDTAERIRSGMLGSTEAIEDLGVYTNVSMIESTEAFKRFANGKHWKDLDFQTQQQIKLAAILEQTYARYGTELANTTQTAHAQFIASLKNIQLALGQAFKPIYSFILPALTALMNGIATVFNVIAQFTTALFGKSNGAKKQIQDTQKQTQATQQQSAAAGGLGKATEKAGKKAKKAGKEAKGALAGFDEINQLDLDKGKHDDSGDKDGADADGTGVPILDMNALGDITDIEVPPSIQKFADDIKRIFNDLGNYFFNIGKLFEPGFNNLAEIFRNGVETAKVFLEPLGQAIGDILLRAKESFDNNIPLVADSFNYLTGQLRDQLNGMFDTIQINAQPFADNVRNIMFSIFDGFDVIFPPVLELFTNFVDVGIVVFGGFGDSALKIFFNLMNNLSKIVKPGMDLVSIIISDVLGTINDFFDKHLADIKTKISTTWGSITNIVTTIFNGIGDIVHDIFGGLLDWWEKNNSGVKETFSKTWEAIWAFLEPLWNIINDVAHWIWENLQYFFDKNSSKIADVITSAWDLIWSIIKPIWDTISEVAIVIFTGLKDFWDKWGKDILDIFTIVWHTISDLFSAALDAITGIFKIFAGIFKGDWSQVWEGIKQVFGGIWDGIKAIFKGATDLLKEVFNIFAKVFKGTWESHWSNIKSFFSATGDGIKTTFSGVTTKIKELFSAFSSPFAAMWSTLWNGVKTIFSNVWNSFTGIVKGVLNGIIGAVNSFIGFWNNIKLEVPSVDVPLVGKVGGFSVGLPTIPTIPKLARGGIVDSPTIAQIGESGKEMVVPLENTSFVDKLAGALGTAVMGAMQFSNGSNNNNSNNGDIYLQIDGTTFARLINPYSSKEKQRLGNNVILQTT